MFEARTNYKASLCKQWQRSQAWPSWMNDTVSPSPTPTHACVRVFASGRLPTMPRACVDVLRSLSRACVRAWMSSYDAACERGRLAFVLSCMRAAFARGRLSTMPRASVAVMRSFSRACVLRSHVDVFLRCCVRAWLSCVRSHVHACCIRTCLRAWTSRVRAWTSSCIRVVYSSCELFRFFIRSGPLH